MIKNFRTWIFALDRWQKVIIQIIFDAIVAKISILLAFFIRLESLDFLHRFDTFIGVLIAIVTTIAVFAGQGVYKNYTRYTSTKIIYKLAFGSTVSCTVLLSGTFLLEIMMPRSVPLIFALLLIFCTAGMRIFISAIGHTVIKEKIQKIAIYGTGVPAIQLMQALQKNTSYQVKLFIDDNREFDGLNLGGIPITNLDNAKKYLRKLEIKTLLLAFSGSNEYTRRRIFDLLSDYPLKVKTIPSISSLISGTFKFAELKDIKIEDLLKRELVQYNPNLMEKTIAAKTILITGAGGSIGSELCRQSILWYPKKLILLDVSEFAIYTLLEELKQHSKFQEIDIIPLIGSVQDKQFMKKVFDRFAVETIFHAAAYKHVPLMEQNVMQCITNNVFGTLNVVELALAAKVKYFTLISTDKAVRPANFMGASKRIAEIICQTLPSKNSNTCFSIVRFGNVLGSSGSVVPLFKKQIEKGGPITLTHLDITRYFMTIPEAAQLVIQAGSISKGGDVFVLDMGKPIKIVDLAKQMVTLSGLKPRLNPKGKLKDDEIAINISGLRSGEKLFEELSYSSNISATIHPRINISNEKSINRKELEAVLNSLNDCIFNNDYQYIYQIITKVTNSTFHIADSDDYFIKRDIKKSSKVVSLKFS